MKKIAYGLFSFAVVMAMGGVAQADSPRPHRPDVMGATPDTFNASWVMGVSQDGGAKGQSLQMTDFAYYSFRNWWDHKLADIKKVQASFMAAAGTVNAGGSPRFSLQLDANGNGVFVDPTGVPTDEDVNVFLDPAHCGDAVAGGWVESDFTADTTNCTIHDTKGNAFVSDGTSTAWEKLVAMYPDAKVWFMFLIQDATTGTNYVDRIKLDSAFFTKQP